MNWLILTFAGIFEVTFVIALKYSDGFTKLWPSTTTIIAGILSLFLLSLALRSIPVGTAYAVWTGIGIAGSAMMGILFFHEPKEAARIISILLLLGGIIGLNLTSTH